MAEQVDSTSTQSAMHTSSTRMGAVGTFRKFLELIRFSHTVFALPFALLASVWALSLPFRAAELSPTVIAMRVLGVLMCMVFARSAAMAFNRLVDVDIDALNPRTAVRHLPAGLLSSRQVWLFFAGNVLAFIAGCTLFLPNWLPLAAAVPVLCWICGYSFAKRFTSAAHLWLGIALALSPICAWVAIRGEELLRQPADLWPAAALALVIALWVAGFDIIYACQDADFDRQAGLRSIPAKLGVAGALRFSAGLHLLMLVVLSLLPSLLPQLSLGVLSYFGLLGVAALIVRQHMLVSADDLGKVNMAFFNINAIISFGLSLTLGIDAWLK